MLSYDRIVAMLRLNEHLLNVAIKEQNLQRIHDLTVHRAALKDCLIELLTNKLQNAA